MKLSSLIGAFATFTALYATSTTTGDKPIFTMKLTVQCNDEEECDNGLPTPFVTQLQDGKRIHNSSIDFAERDAKARSHLGFTVFGQTISEVIYDGTTDRERQFRVDGMHNWKTKSAKYNLLVSFQVLDSICQSLTKNSAMSHLIKILQ